jgi:hypothetical protein
MKTTLPVFRVKGSTRGATRPPIQEMRSQAEVLAYRFPPLVERIKKELKLSQEDAEELFKDMLMFLYLCGTNTTDGRYSPPKMIDEAWHTFIIFTREYAQFCHENFGHFLHHNPFTRENRAAFTKLVVPIIPVARRTFGKLSKNWKRDSVGAICTDDGDCGCP